jgi:hypothetical protein
MTWRMEHLPNFVADDAALMVAEIVVLQARAIQQSPSDEEAYAALYAEVFAQHDFSAWVRLTPAQIAHGTAQLVRQVGLFVLLDDRFALGHLYAQVFWQATLPPVPSARPGPIYTPTRRQQLENRDALHALVHRAAALAWSEKLPSLALGSSAESETLRVQTTAIYNAVVDEAAARNDGTSRMLRQVFATSMQLINQRAISPHEDGVLLTNAPMPSLVCAHWAYREARQVDRLRFANPAAHANFMARRLAVPAWP